MKQLIVKFIFIIAFVGLYFVAIIPVREVGMTFLKEKVHEIKSENIDIFEEGARGMTVNEVGNSKMYKARISFGMNFFIGILGLITISAHRRYFISEVLIQLFFTALIFSAYLKGVQGSPIFLQIADMSSVYFLPLSSLFMVVLGFMDRKMNRSLNAE